MADKRYYLLTRSTWSEERPIMVIPYDGDAQQLQAVLEDNGILMLGSTSMSSVLHLREVDVLRGADVGRVKAKLKKDYLTYHVKA